MELKGEIGIRSSRQQVWSALNDPAVLARCIEGVERLEADGDNRFSGVMNVKVGPVKARFTGTVELKEVDPPHHYVLSGEGKGGVAGFVRGSADVHLIDRGPEDTLLSYAVQSQVGGKLAQLGARLVEGAARGYADQFFEAFRAEVEGEPAVTQASETAAVAGADPSAAQAPGIAPWMWIGALVLLVALTTAWLLGSR